MKNWRVAYSICRLLPSDLPLCADDAFILQVNVIKTTFIDILGLAF